MRRLADIAAAIFCAPSRVLDSFFGLIETYKRMRGF